MKKSVLVGLLLGVCLGLSAQTVSAQEWRGVIKRDADLIKDPTYWRSRAPYVPSIGLSVGMGFTPNYFSPGQAVVEPYVISSYSFRLGLSAFQLGARGYWSDLRFGASWGFSKALTTNIPGGQYARQEYARDIGLSVSKLLFVERNTGIALAMSVGFTVPVSLRSQFRTLITSIRPGLSLSKSFFGRLSLSYSFSTNFNFYFQDAPIYNVELQGIPTLNQRWGMSHTFSVGLAIVQGLSVSAGINIGVGFSFADAYQTAGGPQVFGAENLTAADLSSYSINESNGYSIFFGISYRVNRFLGINLGYSNGGRQYEFQFNDQGERVWQIRNPFRLQNGSFSLGLSGSI